MSRSSTRINTSFVAHPGTLGGFPGGYSIARDPGDRLDDDPRDAPLGDGAVLEGASPSNNVNGPGAPSVRVHLRTVTTRAAELRAEGVDATTITANASLDIRYQGQSAALSIAWRGMTHAHADFHAAHERRLRSRRSGRPGRGWQ